MCTQFIIVYLSISHIILGILYLQLCCNLRMLSLANLTYNRRLYLFKRFIQKLIKFQRNFF